MFSLEIITLKYINMIHIGIDVGGKGGIFAMTDNRKILLKEAIPTIKGSTSVDYEEIVKLLEPFNYQAFEKHVVVEDVHSLFGMSAKSNFNFGLIKGFKIGVLEALGFDYTLVSPKTWQKEIWIEDDFVFNGKKKDTKATSLNSSKRIFPQVDFRKSDRARIPHDGIVDGALMAEYSLRKFNK